MLTNDEVKQVYLNTKGRDRGIQHFMQCLAPFKDQYGYVHSSNASTNDVRSTKMQRAQTSTAAGAMPQIKASRVRLPYGHGALAFILQSPLATQQHEHYISQQTPKLAVSPHATDYSFEIQSPSSTSHAPDYSHIPIITAVPVLDSYVLDQNSRITQTTGCGVDPE